MAFKGFGSYPGPAQPSFGMPPAIPPPLNPFDRTDPAGQQQLRPQQQQQQPWPPQPQRPVMFPHSRGNEQKQPDHPAYPINQHGLASVTAAVGHFAESNLARKTINSQVPERTKSPHLPHPDNFLENRHSNDATAERLRTQTDVPFENRTYGSKWTRSPPLAFESNRFDKNLTSSHEEPQRPDSSPRLLDFQRKSPVNTANSPSYESFRPLDYSDIYDVGKLSPPNSAYFNSPKRARSPLPSDNVSLGICSVRPDLDRPDVSPPRSASKKKFPVDVSNLPSRRSSHLLDYSDIHDMVTLSPSKPANFTSPKRARSPSPSPNVPLGTSSDQHDDEREMKAKAKRLARFNVELRQPMENLNDVMRHKSAEAKHNQVPLDKKNVDTVVGGSQGLVTRGILTDDEVLESSLAVIGLCPDMCPESEREERERKGDLDKHERLDGERNQTSKFLAVKKYNRTAEREADLIRPMPVLQKTVDYLLQLLDQPYNDNFLGIYNFLWDRMRAIRMDLRMQHFFNREAIVMLEQMIRFHIIAMHELCEYKKGEGFSEGFDAHLNIEQMNKTSVELFQMYDDHRKKGNSVQTEKEFRGYYALLKLDKHPGYKVEPAELSHDLSRMTPEIRCTPELLFARDVARACRIGNYIAFFRLAEKATYLQACLMHAHFAKVRRQALASLHSGLQNNQGIPISHVVKWLGMEEEDIESLLEYHGFMLKKFDEIYMVKEGPFLNADTDFPTTCSRLVHFKKSRRIVDDVYSGQILSEVAIEKKFELDKVRQRRADITKIVDRVTLKDEEIVDHKEDYFVLVGTPTKQLIEDPSPPIPNREHVDEVENIREFFHPGQRKGLSEYNHILDDSTSIHEEQFDDQLVSKSDRDVFINEGALPKSEGSIFQAVVSGGSNSNHIIENFGPCAVVSRSLDDEALMCEPNQDETSNEKLRMIIRKWKQRSSTLREIRKQKDFLAAAALNSLSLGPPVRQNKSPPKRAIEELNIDYVAKERHGRLEKLWSGLNVSELVAPVLRAKNYDARCICWKLAVFVQDSGTQYPTNQLASRWLLTKLRGKETDDGLIVHLPELSIWKKWTDTHIGDPQTCCLSVIREAMIDENQPVFYDDVLAGTSCILLVVSETIPWETQRLRLHRLLMAVPSGSRLPLLVVSTDTCKEDITDPSVAIINGLGLHDADKTRVLTFSVVFLANEPLVGKLSGFFSDDRLREGLQWLAKNSPIQPAARKGSTRELVLSYLRYATDTLGNQNDSEVGPDHCISALNEALDRLAEEIITAASTNLNNWPCPEINLLEDSSPEWKLANTSLPSVGWSSTSRVEPLVRAIKACKLASFPDNMTWLQEGSLVTGQIRNQKRAIEEFLTNYLTRSSCPLHGEPAAREASIMLQKGAILELRGSGYHIVPRWLVIFWRIYNWQLMRLTNREFSEAYVLDRFDVPPALELPSRNGAVTPSKMDASIKGSKGTFGIGEYQPVHSVHTSLSLDDMLEALYSVPLEQQQQPIVGSPAHLDRNNVRDNSHVSNTNNGVKARDELRHASNSDGDVSRVETSEVVSLSPLSEKNYRSSPLTEMNDRLAMLLEQCKWTQDLIDEKLAVYF